MATTKQITRVREAAKQLELAEANILEAKREFSLAVKDLEGKGKKEKNSASQIKQLVQSAQAVESPAQNVGVSDRILALIQSDPKKVWSFAEVGKRLPEAKIDSIRALLPRLVRLGKATKEGRGKFKYNGLV
jgi:hypothetical protein